MTRDTFRIFLYHKCCLLNERQRETLACRELIIQSKALLKQIRRRSIVEPTCIRV